MAYYKKIEVKRKIMDVSVVVGIKLINSIEQANMQLENEEDVVGLFWMGESFEMKELCFVRIDYDLYTDDRYALDSYAAQKENKTASEYIKNKMKEIPLHEREERANKMKEYILNRKK